MNELIATRPYVTNVLIVGEPLVGGTVTGSYKYHNDDASPEAGSTYLWYIDGTPAQRTQHLHLGPEHAGKHLIFAVAPRSLAGEVGDLGISGQKTVAADFQGISIDNSQACFLKQRGNFSFYTEEPADRVFVSTAGAFAAIDPKTQKVFVEGENAWGADVPADMMTLFRNNPATRLFSTERCFAALIDLNPTQNRLLVWGPGIAVDQGTFSDVESVYANRSVFAFTYRNPQGPAPRIGAIGPSAESANGALIPGDIQLELAFDAPKAIYSTEMAFAVLTKGGQVFAWGNPASGGTINALAKDQLKDMVVDRIVATDSAFCASDALGKIVTWGATDRGGTIPGNVLESILNDGGAHTVFANCASFVVITRDQRRAYSFGKSGLGGDMSEPARELAIRGEIALCRSSNWAHTICNDHGHFAAWGAVAYGGSSRTPGNTAPETDISVLFERSDAKAELQAYFQAHPIARQSQGPVTHTVRTTSGNTVALHATDSSFFLYSQSPSGSTEKVVVWGQPDAGGSLPLGVRQVLESSVIESVHSTNNAYGVILTQKDVTGVVVVWGASLDDGDAGEIPPVLHDHLKSGVIELYSIKSWPPREPPPERVSASFAARFDNHTYGLWGGNVRDQLYDPSAPDGPRLLAPTVDQATGGNPATLDPYLARNGAIVRVPANPALLPTDKVQVIWTATTAAGSYSSGQVDANPAGMSFTIPATQVAFTPDTTVRVRYIVTRNGVPLPDSPTLTLNVQKMPSANLPTPKVYQDGVEVTGSTLEVSKKVEIRIYAWPLWAAGQRVWLYLAGKKAGNVNHDLTAWTASAVTSSEIQRGYLTKTIEASYLTQLLNGSTLTTTFKVTFDGSTTEANATVFPVRTLTVVSYPILLAPTVEQATGGNPATLNPYLVRDGAIVRVPANPALLPTDKVQVIWTATTAAGSYTTGQVNANPAGMSFTIPAAQVAFTPNTEVKVKYIVTRDGKVLPDSPTLTLNVQKMPSANLPTPKVYQDGIEVTGSTLEVSKKVEIRIYAWPLWAAGQRVWLYLAGKKAGNVNHDLTAWTASAVTSSEIQRGYLTKTIEASYLTQLLNGSTLTTTFKVTFDGSTTEANATVFPVRTLTVVSYPALNFDTSSKTLSTSAYYSVRGRPPVRPPASAVFTRTASGGVTPYTYNSSDSGVAIVDASSGEVKAAANGTSTITVTDKAGQTASYLIVVTGVKEVVDLNRTASQPNAISQCQQNGLQLMSLDDYKAFWNIYYPSSGAVAQYLGWGSGTLWCWSRTNINSDFAWAYNPNGPSVNNNGGSASKGQLYRVVGLK